MPAAADELDRIVAAARRTLGDGFRRLAGDGGIVGGFSNEVVVLEEPGGRRVLVRVPPVEGPYPPYDVAREGRLLARIEGAVDVPRVLAIDEGEAGATRPFVVVEWLDGSIKLPGRADIGDADEAARARADAVMGALATVHAVDWRALELPELLGVDPAVPLAERYLDRWETALGHLGVAAPSACWYALGWLRERVPEETETTLVHGDFRLGNLLWGARRVSVLDWETATLGDPLFDLAWTLMGTVSEDALAMGLISKRETVRLYERHRGVTVDRDRLRWWEVMAVWLRLCMEARSFDFENRQPVPDLRCTLWQYGSLRTTRDLLGLIARETEVPRALR